MALTDNAAGAAAHHALSPDDRSRILKRKIISLIGSIIVSLSAGSNYAFSSFAPQLQESLHLTSTQINLIGIAGNAGVYLSSPIWGRFIDKRGPQTALISAAILVPIGYAGLSASYNRDWSLHSTSMLFFLNLLTGLGNSGGFTAAMNAQAKSWGGSRRGTATALVLSGFGLSAFFYSTLSHWLFPGNTGDYLLLLAFGSMTSMLIGLGLIKIIPPIEHLDREEQGVRNNNQSWLKYLRRRTSSDIGARATIWQQPEALSADTTDDEENHAEGSNAPSTALRAGEGEREEEEVDPESQSLLSGRDECKTRSNRAEIDPHQIDISGRRLFKQVDFYLIFFVMTLVSGAGLLLINNVGTITKTLWDYNHRDNPILVAAANNDLFPLSSSSPSNTEFNQLKINAKSSIQQLQAHQVSAISLSNFSGRILIGLLSDWLVNQTLSSANRVWLLIVVTLLALVSQLFAAYPEAISTVDSLFAISILTGLAYGTLFGVCPTLVFEWFGMKHFSQNYGFVSLSPVVAGNIFNLLFGRIYDSHVPNNTMLREEVGLIMKGNGDRDHEAARHLCMDGEECYRQVFVVTSIGCGMAVVLSLVLIGRRAKSLPAFLNR